MRTWPEALYPHLYRPDRFRQRPWWRLGDGHLERSDRTYLTLYPDVFANRNRYCARRVSGNHTDVVWVRAKDTDEAMSWLDHTYPVPFPGIRVGQVWGQTHLRETSLFTVAEYDQMRQDWDPWDKRKVWRLGQDWMSQEEASDLLSDCYLLADPCAPDLAPWAPTEGDDVVENG